MGGRPAQGDNSHQAPVLSGRLASSCGLHSFGPRSGRLRCGELCTVFAQSGVSFDLDHLASRRLSPTTSTQTHGTGSEREVTFRLWWLWPLVALAPLSHKRRKSPLLPQGGCGRGRREGFLFSLAMRCLCSLQEPLALAVQQKFFTLSSQRKVTERRS